MATRQMPVRVLPKPDPAEKFELIVMPKDGPIRDMIEMIFNAYDEQALYLNSLFPRRFNRGAIIDRIEAISNQTKSIVWLRVIDKVTKKLVSASQWVEYDSVTDPAVEFQLGHSVGDDSQEHMELMMDALNSPRFKRVEQEGAPFWCLNMMATVEEYRREGAAFMQMRHIIQQGTEKAMYVCEATEGTKELSERYDFGPRSEIPPASHGMSADHGPGVKMYLMERPRELRFDPARHRHPPREKKDVPLSDRMQKAPPFA